MYVIFFCVDKISTALYYKTIKLKITERPIFIPRPAKQCSPLLKAAHTEHGLVFTRQRYTTFVL